MKVAVSVSDTASARLRTGDSITVATGLYRICEQGLLNAAVHGHATECRIQLSLDAQGRIVLSLHDNGVGLPASPTPAGMGTTVISAWSQALDGAWSLESADVGARLTAVIPAG